MLRPFAHIFTKAGLPFFSDGDVIDARDFIARTPTEGRSVQK